MKEKSKTLSNLDTTIKSDEKNTIFFVYNVRGSSRAGAG